MTTGKPTWLLFYFSVGPGCIQLLQSTDGNHGKNHYHAKRERNDLRKDGVLHDFILLSLN